MLSTQLVAPVQRLYEVFARYPCPNAIECCPCGCTQPEATAHLLVTPLLGLTPADLLDYSVSAITTQGSVDDFRYLLPRVLHVVAEDPIGCSPEILFGKLRYANWLSWPEDEVEVLRAYLNALWLTALRTFPVQKELPGFFEIETVLASIASTGASLNWYLNIWTNTPAREADQNLIQFVTLHGDMFSEGRFFTEGFWSDSETQARELRYWLLQPDTIDRIGNAGSLLPSDGFEHLFQPALDGLRKESRT